MPKNAQKAAMLMVASAYLHGCANSASHQVLKEEYAGDAYLTCSELAREKRKAQVVIRGVEQDKEDMTGADVVDGLLWFPFNVIAKQSNYSSATQAAEARIDNLTMLEVKRGCRTDIAGDNNSADQRTAQQLRELNSLYKSGVLTKDEYISKKTTILSTIGQEQPTRQQQPSAHIQTAASWPPPKPGPVGKHLYQAEKAAAGCHGVTLTASKYGKDVYTAKCPGGDKLISCEYGQCTLLD